jgi:hypothetical protein
MTRQRDLKRLVRERQARTGESYMTARRHILGERPDPVPGATPAPAFVVDFIDVSDIAAVLGIKCRVLVLPALAERVDVSAMLRQLHGTLTASARDRDLALMRSVVLRGQQPLSPSPALAFRDTQFMVRARLGLGGISDSGLLLSFAIAGRTAAEQVMFMLWITPPIYFRVPPALIISTADLPFGDPIDPLAAELRKAVVETS